jgi:hypothetical protein
MAKKKTEVVMVSVARLDEKNIYQGVEFISPQNITSDHVEVPSDCDLKVGKYQWDVENQTFLPTLEFLLEIKNAKRNRKGG